MGGILGKILGPKGLGLTGGEQDTTQEVDPLTQKLNQLKFDILSTTNQDTGGLGNLLRTLNFYSNPSSDVTGAAYNAGNYASLSGLDSGDWYTKARADLNPEFYLNNAKDYFNRIVKPQNSNNYSLLGLGRSGAVEEANAKAGAELSLPISQQYLGNLANLNQAYPQVDIGLRGAQLSRLSQAPGLYDYGRLQQFLGKQAQLQGYLSGFNATPYTPAVSQSGTSNQGLLSSLGGLGGVATGILGYKALSGGASGG